MVVSRGMICVSHGAMSFSHSWMVNGELCLQGKGELGRGRKGIEKTPLISAPQLPDSSLNILWLDHIHKHPKQCPFYLLPLPKLKTTEGTS